MNIHKPTLPSTARLWLQAVVMLGGVVTAAVTNNSLWVFLALGADLLFVSRHFWPVSVGLLGVFIAKEFVFLVAGLVIAGILFVQRSLELRISWRFLVHYLLSILECARHRWANALIQINKALQVSPESDFALVQRATIYWFQDRMTDMEVDARRLVEMQPQNWYHHRLLGQSLCCQSRYEEALVSFMKSLEAIPEIKPRKFIGAWYARRCEIPREAQVLSDIGGMHYILTDFATAIQYYKAALAAQPTRNIRRESLFRLGKCYEALGCHEDAQAAFAKMPAERDGLRRLQRQARTWPSTNAQCAKAKLELIEMEQLVHAHP
jgi:tetratricopeptide (TPR) repeat protein